MNEISDRFLYIKSKKSLIINSSLNKFRFKEFVRKSTIGYSCILQYPQHIPIGENYYCII